MGEWSSAATVPPRLLVHGFYPGGESFRQRGDRAASSLRSSSSCTPRRSYSRLEGLPRPEIQRQVPYDLGWAQDQRVGAGAKALVRNPAQPEASGPERGLDVALTRLPVPDRTLAPVSRVCQVFPCWETASLPSHPVLSSSVFFPTTPTSNFQNRTKIELPQK
eukprot:COSAG02_NODE_580_length_20059_cov_3.703908_3_plen_163_part_00